MAGYQSLVQDLQSEGIMIVAGSVDPMEKARETVEKSGITYPVAWGLDVEAVSKVTGIFYASEKKHLQPAGFLLRPDKTIEIACYSSGPIGRLVAEDVLRVVRFLKSRKGAQK